MHALIYDGTTVRLASVPDPVPGPGEALIRPTLGSIGRLEVEIARGRFGGPGVLGREFVGVVESVHPGADRGLVGKRVVGSPSIGCGTCDLCTGGLGEHCRGRTLLGVQGRDGCLAERFTLPIRNLVPVPDSLGDESAVFATLLAAAIQARRQLTITRRPYLTVLGDGPLGLLTAQVMAQENASVRLIGRHAAKLALCEKWGVKHRHADEIGRRADQDVVVDCTGARSGLELALRLVRPRGTVLLKSLPVEAEGALDALVTSEVVLIGSHGGPVSEAVARLERREIDVAPLVSKRVRLDGDGAALLAAAEPRTVLRVLVML